jgi:hypothetical protein
MNARLADADDLGDVCIAESVVTAGGDEGTCAGRDIVGKGGRAMRRRLLVQARQRPALRPRKNGVALFVVEGAHQDVAQEPGNAHAERERKTCRRRDG